jgi:hypothetical protein
MTLASRGGNRDQDDLVGAGNALGLLSGSLGGAEVSPVGVMPIYGRAISQAL